MSFLLVDVGSTSIKYAESDGCTLCGVKSVPFPARIDLPPPYAEYKAESIIAILRSVLDSSAADAVLFCVQMHGYLLADAEGKLLTNYISWQDERAGIAGVSFKPEERHGVAAKNNLPRSGVLAMEKLCPDVARSARQFFTLGSYIGLVFAGSNVTHITDAAASGFYDAVTCRADESPLLLPEARKNISAIGKYGNKLIYTPAGDQQTAVYGTIGFDEDKYVLNIGTAAQICTLSPRFLTGKFESRPYFGEETLCTVTNRAGGRFLVRHSGEAGIAGRLAESYGEGLNMLPARKCMVVTGGALRYYRREISDAVKMLNVPFVLNEKSDTLAGLQRLAREVKNG